MKKRMIWIAALLLAATAQAQTPDGGVWGSVQAGHSWSNGWYANVRAEYRQRGTGLDLWFVRPTVGRRLTPWLKVDLGADRFATSSAVQLRGLLSATVTLKQGPLTASLRERYILSRNVHSGTVGHLFRSQLKVAYTVPQSVLTPYVAVEVYGWDHWRQTHHFAGTRLRLGKTHAIDLFYLYGTSASKPELHAIGVGYEATL